MTRQTAKAKHQKLLAVSFATSVPPLRCTASDLHWLQGIFKKAPKTRTKKANPSP